MQHPWFVTNSLRPSEGGALDSWGATDFYIRTLTKLELGGWSRGSMWRPGPLICKPKLAQTLNFVDKSLDWWGATVSTSELLKPPN